MRDDYQPSEIIERAERIFAEVKKVDRFLQLKALERLLDDGSNESDRAALEVLVFSWLQKTDTAEPEKSYKHILTPNRIILGTFSLVFLVAWWELGASVVWSSLIAFSLVVVLHLVFRAMDRGFVFRRLFTACITSGLFLIVPAQVSAALETPWGFVRYNGGSSLELLAAWGLATILTGLGAFWEHKVSNRT